MITEHSPTPPSTQLLSPQPLPPAKSAIDAVFEKLLADIVSGTYSTGARLPAERELAKQLGASRPTLREALRRLGEWNLVQPRRGSGIAVQDVNDWMIDVLPSYLRYAEPGPDSPSTPQMVKDMLHLRRSLMSEIMAMVASRIPTEKVAAVREGVHQAWERRQANEKFATADLDVLRSLVGCTNFLPGLWMLNQMSGIYNDLAKSMGRVLAPSEGHVAAWDGVLDSLEEGDPDQAIAKLNQYLASHDERLLALLELLK
jgi:GntR family transcriptional repressor for pyruvate dehydrogenase complex